jgi:hypothetical protein
MSSPVGETFQELLRLPTQVEFEQAARRFEEAARLVEQAGQRPQRAMGPRTMWGGRVTAQTNDVLRRSRADTGRVASQLLSMAAECRRRAAVTGSVASDWAAYDSAYASYESDLAAYNDGAADVAPTPPSAPPAGPGWAEF